MLTTTEIILFITVWALTGCGLFFGIRGMLRRRRRDRNGQTRKMQ